MVFFHVHIDSKATIAKIVELATLSRKQGLLALEEQIKAMRRILSSGRGCSWWSTAQKPR